jgi:hypothetical protein
MPTRPVPFPGTEEERQENKKTHRWGGEEGRCFLCDAKPWHVAADYPCGAEVPREYICRESSSS